MRFDSSLCFHNFNNMAIKLKRLNEGNYTFESTHYKVSVYKYQSNGETLWTYEVTRKSDGFTLRNWNDPFYTMKACKLGVESELIDLPLI